MNSSDSSHNIVIKCGLKCANFNQVNLSYVNLNRVCGIKYDMKYFNFNHCIVKGCNVNYNNENQYNFNHCNVNQFYVNIGNLNDCM